MSVEDPRLPENPAWKSHWIREAKYGETHLRLADNELRSADGKKAHPHFKRFSIGRGPISCSKPNACPQPNEPHFKEIWFGDSLEKAHEYFKTCFESIIKNEPRKSHLVPQIPLKLKHT